MQQLDRKDVCCYMGRKSREKMYFHVSVSWPYILYGKVNPFQFCYSSFLHLMFSFCSFNYLFIFFFFFILLAMGQMYMHISLAHPILCVCRRCLQTSTCVCRRYLQTSTRVCRRCLQTSTCVCRRCLQTSTRVQTLFTNQYSCLQTLFTNQYSCVDVIYKPVLVCRCCLQMLFTNQYSCVCRHCLQTSTHVCRRYLQTSTRVQMLFTNVIYKPVLLLLLLRMNVIATLQSIDFKVAVLVCVDVVYKPVLGDKTS